MYQKIKEFTWKHKNKILIIVTIIINCLLYYNYLIGHFAVESYAIAGDYKYYAVYVYLADGRILSSIFIYFAGLFGIPILMLMSISLFLGICILTIAIWILKNSITRLVKTNYKQELLIWLLCYAVLFNYIMIEILYFPEACIMCLSILFNILASRLFTDKKYVKSALLLLLGVFCYQGTIGLFIICSCLFSIIKNKKKCLFKDIVKIGIISLIISIINLTFIKLMANVLQIEQNKIFELDINSILENISIIFQNTYYVLIESCGLFPRYFIFIFIQLILVLSLILMYKEQKIEIPLYTGFILIISIICSFAIFIIQTNSICTGRVHFCIGALVGIELLYLYSATNLKEYKTISKVFYLVLGVYLAINIVNTIQLTYEHQLVNQLEKNECEKIESIIEKYEEQGGIVIDRIIPIVIYNEQEKGFFEETKRRTIITYNNTRHFWGYVGIINYYLNREFIINVGLTEQNQRIYLDYINQNNMQIGDIVCIDNAVYCPQYLF